MILRLEVKDGEDFAGLNYSKPTNFGVFSPGNKLPKFQNSLHLSSGNYT